MSTNLGNGSETRSYDKRGRLSSLSTVGPDPGNNTPGKGSVTIAGSEQSANTGTATGSVLITGAERRVSVCPDTCHFVYDFGNVIITVNGTQYVYGYAQGDTNLTVASGLTTKLNNGTLVNATYDSSGNITLTARQGGSCCNYSLSTYSETGDHQDFGTSTSFPATPSGSNLSGGVTTYDSGNVSISVNNAPASSYTYGSADSASSIASGLVTKFNSSYATATLNGAVVEITAIGGGPGTDYPLSTNVTYDTSHFSQASFSATPSGSELSGGTNGEGTIYTLSMGYAPNGDITAANDSVNGNWTYGYDDFNRLLNASGPQAYSYGYDRYGNRWQETPGPQYSFTGNGNGNNNRIDSNSGVIYDAAGNMTSDGLGNTYFYDAENRLIQVGGSLGGCSAATACYVYDGEGRRVSKMVGGVSVYDVYDLTGHQVAEVNSAGAWTRGEVYAGSRHLATYSGGSTGVTYFSASDWQDTERVRTGVSGPLVETCTNLPFGDALTCSGSEVDPMHFTGQQLDTETNLTNAWLRGLSTTQGRWIRPDPAGLAAADPTNPQTWNRYADVLNNPLAFVDPTGLDCVYLNDAGDGAESIDHDSVSSSCDQSGGYWIWGTVDSNFPININVDAGLVSGYGVDAFGNVMYTLAGAAGSNPWGYWNQSFVTGSPIDAAVAANNQPNIYYLQAKVFLTGLGRNFVNEFREGGCFRQFAEEAFDPASEIGGQDAAIKSAAQSGAYTAATAYAIKQGLTVPMRSSIVRGILDTGEFAGEAVALGATVYDEGKAFINEMVSFAHGECH